MEADISLGWALDEKGFLVAAVPAQPAGDGPVEVWGVHSVSGSIAEWAHDELVDLASSTPSVCYRTLEGAKAGALRNADLEWEDMREYWDGTPENGAPGHDGTLEWSDPYGTGRFLRAEDFKGDTIWAYKMELI